ncbi:TetR/AcrR family transcriptional regulator [Novosphingobium taihuense]|uniref:AcrR family transcriptional regulator n=1 Tax=Novosphingobium taihuense TaxID=260085 RepID=A0A7W7ABY7_9SPHN|nr:TetR family transcriptional regulator [Novosphingobium taihuense]MBB4614213.1 AcrR family transcriptional regulator [Novosphingobium taihuense]
MFLKLNGAGPGLLELRSHRQRDMAPAMSEEISITEAAGNAPNWSSGAVSIMQTAELLMGRHGIEGVSMRQITRAAKMANNSAIAYHFGDRDGLLRAISNWRDGTVSEERSRMFAQMQQSGDVDCPLHVLQAITRPVLAIRNEDGTHPHAAFVSEMLRSRIGREIRQTVFGSSSIIAELIRRLKSFAPEVSQSMFEFRMRTGSLAFYDAVVERDQMAKDDPARLSINDEAFLAELDSMTLAIILRPALS